MSAPLSNYANFVRGVTFPASETSTEPFFESLPVLRAGNIDDTLRTDDDLVFVHRRFISETQMLQCGDSVICLSSGSPKVVGKSAISSKNWEGSVGGFCGIIRPNKKADSLFLHLWLRSDGFIAWRDSNARGANIQNIRFTDLTKVEVSFPDVVSQKSIAARLTEQLDEFRRLRQAAEAQAHASGKLLEKFLANAFHGICPLSLGINQAVPPDGWTWKPLPSLARLESGHTPSRRCPEYWTKGDVPWLALPDIRALDCRIANETCESTNALGLANSSARLLPKDTVALSRTASVGFVTIFGRPMATSQDFVNWICGSELHPKFLLWLLRVARKFVLDQSTGAIHKTVYMDVVQRF
ncbi:MAG: restriction endonuclease subunit S, partial [Terrimicrobiaceae bacterium]